MRYGIAFALAASAAIWAADGDALVEEWKLKGDWVESCSCQAACPCVFESAPTLGHCEGSALFEIEEGHYGDVEVDGLAAVITYRIGEWLRIYVDDEATKDQVDAVVNVLNQESTFGELFSGDTKLLSVERADISVDKSDSRIAFSVPDARVALEEMTGANAEPIRIENLNIPWFANGYRQYKALTTSHQRGEVHFAYSGTNGAVSHVDASGEIASDD